MAITDETRNKLRELGVNIENPLFRAFSTPIIPHMPKYSPSTFRRNVSKEEASRIRSVKQNIMQHVMSNLDNLSGDIFGGNHIWRSISRSTRHNVLHQYALENAPNITGGIVFDIETVGNIAKNPSGMDYFGITELTAKPFSYSGGGARGVSFKLDDLSPINYAIKQSNDGARRLYDWIDHAKSGHALMDHQRMAIESLMKYDPNHGANIVNGMLHSQANIDSLKDLRTTMRRFTDNELESARRGLKYLQDSGKELKDAMKEFAEMVSRANASGHALLSQNGIEFDIPRIYHAAKSVGVDMTPLQQARHLDVLQLMKAFPDTYRSIYGGMPMQVDGLGELQLEQIARSILPEEFTKNLVAHMAADDTEITARSFFEMMDNPNINLREQLIKAKYNFDDANPIRLHKGLKYDTRPIQIGDVFFSLRGRQAGEADAIIRTTRTGENHIVEFPSTSFRGSSFYKFLGYTQMGEGEDRRFMAVFDALGVTDGEAERHVLSGSSREELAEKIHQLLTPWDTGAHRLAALPERTTRGGLTLFDVEKEAEYIQKTYTEDLAIRRYRKMFSVDSGGGYDLLRKALGYERLYREGDEKKLRAYIKRWKISPEMVRDFETMMPRLSSEADIWRRVIREIDAAGYETDFQKDLAIEIANEEMRREIEEARKRGEANISFDHRRRRRTHIFERYQLPLIDPATKEITWVNIHDKDSLRDSLMNFVYKQQRGSTQAERDRSVKVAFSNLLEGLSRSHVIDGNAVPQIISPRAARNLVNKGERLDAQIRALADMIVGEQIGRTVRPIIETESLAPRSQQFVNFFDDNVIGRFMGRVKSKMNMTQGLANASLQEMLNKYYTDIAPRGYRYGMPDIMGAMNRLQAAFLSNNMGVKFAFRDGSDGGGWALRMVLHERDAAAEANAIRFLSSERRQQIGDIPRNLSVIDIPLADERGIIMVGNRKLNTISHLTVSNRRDVLRGATPQFQIETNFDRMARRLAERAKFVSEYAQSGDWDSVSYHLGRARNDVISMLTSPTHGADGSELSLRHRGSQSDYLRRHLIDASDLTLPALQQLKRLGYKSDTTKEIEYLEEALDKLGPGDRIQVQRFMKRYLDQYVLPTFQGDPERGIPPVYGFHEEGAMPRVESQGTRASQLAKMQYNLLDARDLVALSAYDKPGRENVIQMLNYRPLEGLEQGLMRDIDGLAYAGPLLTTDAEMNALATTDSKIPGVYSRGLIMNDEQIGRAIQRAKDAGRISEDTFNFITRPTTYEQQMVISEDLAQRMVTRERKTPILLEKVTDEARKMIEEGKLRRGMILGQYGGVDVGFDAVGDYFDNVQLTKVRDGYVLSYEVVRRLREGDKITLSTGEKGTIQSILSRETMDSVFGKGIHWIAHFDVAKHGDYGGLIRSRIAGAALDILGGRTDMDMNELADMTSKLIDAPVRVGEAGNLIMPHSDALKAITPERLREFDQALNARGIRTMVDLDGEQVLSRVDEIRVINVADRAGGSHIIGDGDPRIALNTRGRISWREYSALERKGMSATVRWLEGHMFDSLGEAGSAADAMQQKAIQEARHMIRAVQANVYETHRSGIPVFGGMQFAPAIAGGELTRDGIVGTLFDESGVQNLIRSANYDPASYRGVIGIRLPEEVQVILNQRTKQAIGMDTIYMPILSPLSAGDDRMFLDDLQSAQNRVIRSIHRYAEEFANVPQGGKVTPRDELVEGIRKSVQGYIDELAKIGDSDGFLARRMISTQIESSGRGKVKIISPEVMREALSGSLGPETERWRSILENENIIFMSEDRARKMGLGDDIIERLRNPNQGFYGLSQRYPNIHHKTIDVTRFFVHDALQGDEVYMTPGLAQRFNADSDGDFLSMFFATAKKHLQSVQDEMEQVWMSQNANREESFWHTTQQDADRKYRNMIARNERIWERLVDPNDTSFWKDLQDGALSPWITDHADAIDIEAKLGKQMIGAVSNTVQRVRTLAQSMYDHGAISEQTRDFVEEFAAIAEQKSIDTKHLETLDEAGMKLYFSRLTSDHHTDPNTARRLLGYISSQDREGFLKEFASEGGMFENNRQYVDAFFNVLRMDPDATDQMKREVFFSSGASSGGLESLAESLLSGKDLENSRRVRRILGEEFQDIFEEGMSEFRRSMFNTDPGAFEYSPSTHSRVGRDLLSEIGDKKTFAKAGLMGVGAIALAGMMLNIGRRDSSPPDPSTATGTLIQPDTGGNNAYVMEEGTGYDGYSIRIRGRDRTGQDASQLAETVQQSIASSMPFQVNTNMNVRDDTRSMSNQWVEELFMNALNRGYA